MSTPPGATVEIGQKIVNGVVTPGTGRIVGTTPLTAQLMASDVTMFNGEAGLDGEMRLSGYDPHFFDIGLGPGGSLQPGRTYEESLTLNPIQ